MYPTGQGSNIGTLLRLIQEDQNKSIPAINPANDPNSPMRGAIQGPINAPESPGSSRVVSVRPEGAIQQGEQVQGQVIGPVAPVAPVAQVSGPVAPQASQQRPSSGGGGVSAPQISAPSIGTRITAAPVNRGTSIPASAGIPMNAKNPAYQPAQPSRSVQPSTSKSGGSQGAFGGTVGATARALPEIVGGLLKAGVGTTLLPGVTKYIQQTINPKASSKRI